MLDVGRSVLPEHEVVQMINLFSWLFLLAGEAGLRVYGEGSVFSVEIKRNAKGEALQKAIFDGQRYHERFSFPPSELTLYLAGKKEGEEIKWLKDDDNLDALLQGDVDKQYMKMRSSWILESYFGGNFQPGRQDIHVLVELPEAAACAQPMLRAVFWLVTGSVENALHTRGVRGRLYQIADAELGYYDPTNVLSDNKARAFWYTNNDLQINVLFKKEAHALYFQSRLRAEFVTIPITSLVSEAPCPRKQERIYSDEYGAQESASPQGSMSSFPSDLSVIDPTTPVFKYQRIEADGVFGPYGKAESAHLMLRSHCRKFATSYEKYDDDDNNRLALSRLMHCAYDGLGFDFPMVNMEVVGVSVRPVFDKRYKVDLHVSVYSQDYYAFLLKWLKDESSDTSDPLVMKTFVHVEDPVIFCECMAWNHKNIEQLRQDYFSMNWAMM
ncbi:hypothetical protein V7S43_016462 [Phytophthora oleae]|uniref:Crinkler effector protein N-terminal domain-containing protein n=1 Tax=Phytophthora oleae TaxID=2107226 RepID=A0ABD3EVU3_9STRA